MVGRSGLRLLVAILATLTVGPTVLHGQPVAPGSRRVVDGNTRLATRWGSWDGGAGKATQRIERGTTAEPIVAARFHAEAQYAGVMAADFVYSAAVTFHQGAEAGLQFRVSNEGRYGVVLESRGVRLYSQVRQVRDHLDAGGATDAQIILLANELLYEPLAAHVPPIPLAHDVPHRVSITARGPKITVTVDDLPPLVTDRAAMGAGRFGLYVYGPENASARFDRVVADAAVTEASNFALLYNTLGYETAWPKRALVRTLAELPEDWVKEARFTLVTSPGNQEYASAPLTYSGKSLGMSMWEADFSLVDHAGDYVLSVVIEGREDRAGQPFRLELVSSPFEIGSGLVTRRMLRQLALLNPEARRAADEDRVRHWDRKSGAFRVTDDGMIIARGDEVFGAVLERTGNGYDAKPWDEVAFTLSGEMAIDHGCDAQLQFQVTPASRYAVTLQGGSATGCSRGGASAVRLHHETSQGGYQELGTKILPGLQRGRMYRVVVTVYGDTTNGTFGDVDVDDVRMLSGVPLGNKAGKFAIKAWGAEARFDRVLAWRPGLEFVLRGGVRIPIIRGSHGLMVTCEEGTHTLDGEQRKRVCNPIFAQRHGFHDCNNYIGEGTSHGTFLAGLMEVWTRRRDVLQPAERASLLRAIVATAGYLDELQRTAGFTGEYAHEEPSRGAREGASGYYQVLHGLYGDAALASKGYDLDPGHNLARAACIRASRAVSWLLAEETRFSLGQHTRFPLTSDEKPWYDNMKSIVYAQLAQCASREPEAVLPPLPIEELKRAATEAAVHWLAHLNANLPREPRPPGRAIPWLEGIDEVLALGGNSDLRTGLNALATKLEPPGGFFGFHALPQGGEDQWKDRTRVPQGFALPQTNPPLTWYTTAHFASSATDAAILAFYTGHRDARKVAAGSLGWILGLNPGVPSTKALPPPTHGRPWTAAAFVSSLDAPSARSWEAFMTPATVMKSWVWPREEHLLSVHREPWLVEPQNREFMSLVNGHVLWDGEWDYWNQGEHGWMSGETFLMHDGAFLKAALVYEDAQNGRWPQQAAAQAPPQDVSRVRSFATTLDQRKQTGWGFENIGEVTFAHAGRMAHELCRRRGYAGGRVTGRQEDERVWVVCLPLQNTFVFDVNQEKIHTTQWSFDHIDTVDWARASRSAERLCAALADPRVGGFYTGHQTGELRGVVCAGLNSAHWHNPPQGTFPFADLNTVTWQEAARAASGFCSARGYAGGFFNGQQGSIDGQPNDLHKGIVCLGPPS